MDSLLKFAIAKPDSLTPYTKQMADEMNELLAAHDWMYMVVEKSDDAAEVDRGIATDNLNRLPVFGTCDVDGDLISEIKKEYNCVD